MKKFTVLLAILLGSVSIGTAQTQKRITVSTPNLAKSIGSHTEVSKFKGVSTVADPTVNTIHNNGSTPVFPNYLVAEEGARNYYRSAIDTAGWIISSVDNTKAIFGAPCQIPSGLNINQKENKVLGLGQFFVPNQTERGGQFIIDTVVMLPYQYPYNGNTRTPLKDNVLLIGYSTKANIITPSALTFEFPTDDTKLKYLGEVEIPFSTINSSAVLDDQGRLQSISPTYIQIPNWTVERDESFGFFLYLQGVKDSIEVYGTFMTDPSIDSNLKCMGFMLRQDVISGVEYLTKDVSLVRLDPDGTFGADYPMLANRSIKANYECLVAGLLTTNSVETLTNDAKNFSLEQVAPNPVVNATKIQFSLQEPSTVSLRVVNSLGQVVQELASGAMATGTYAADFDATNLPAGMYYYTLTAGTHSLTRSMVVVK